MGSEDKKKSDQTNVMKLDQKRLIPDVRKDFGSGLEVGRTLHFVGVPQGVPRESEEPWRVLLIPTDVKLPTIALDVWGDAVIGRGEGADVDLTGHFGNLKGVSRRHARLRPTPTALFIMDLKSSNGTQVNGVPLGPGMALKLRHNDNVAFGNLHFTVNILHQPPDTSGEAERE